MRLRATLIALIVGGCSSPAVDPAPDANSGMTEVQIASQVTDFTPGGYLNEVGLADVEVCVDGSEPRHCVHTGEDGRFEMGALTPEAEILLVYTKAGFVPLLQPLVTPRWDSTFDAAGHVRMSSLSTDEAQVAGLNAVLRTAGEPELLVDREASGSVLFGALENFSSTLPTFLATLDPSSGDGPYFGLANESLVRELPPNTASAFGVYYNVEPDDYELVFTRADGHCAWAPGAVSGWRPRSGRENASRIVVRAGHTTWWTAQQCPADETDAGLDADAGAP